LNIEGGTGPVAGSLHPEQPPRDLAGVVAHEPQDERHFRKPAIANVDVARVVISIAAVTPAVIELQPPSGSAEPLPLWPSNPDATRRREWLFLTADLRQAPSFASLSCDLGVATFVAALV